MALMTEQEGIDELKRIIPSGEVFGVSAIQRHLRWGYNRAYRALLFAVGTGQANYAEGSEYRIVWTEALREIKKQPIDRPWNQYPLRTKAYAIGGGFWIRLPAGWKWHCGSTFPTPGGDAFCVELPEPEEPAEAVRP